MTVAAGTVALNISYEGFLLIVDGLFIERMLSYMGYIGVRGPKGFGFQPFWS